MRVADAGQPIAVFGVPIPGVFPAPDRLGTEPGSIGSQGGLDVGPLENVGGTMVVRGPEGEVLPVNASPVPVIGVPGGVLTKAVGRVLETSAGRRLFVKGILNNNRFLRIGLGRKGGESVFRIAFGKRGLFKLDIVNFGRIPKVGP